MSTPHAPIDAIAFDFDGTLADTSAAVVASVQQTLRELRAPPLARDAIVGRMGLPLADVFVAAGIPAADVSEAVLRYRRIFPDHSRAIALFPGALACLHELGRTGVRLGITSSRGRESLGVLVEQLELDVFFAEVLGDEDALHKKPAPHLVLELGRRLRIVPERMLVVGDTTFDIDMGHAAGALTCAVSHGSHDAARLRGANPTFLVDSLAELLALVHRLRAGHDEGAP
jgi:phosphoglycolate phosphatase